MKNSNLIETGNLDNLNKFIVWRINYMRIIDIYKFNFLEWSKNLSLEIHVSTKKPWKNF